MEDRADRDYPSFGTKISKSTAGVAGWQSEYAGTHGVTVKMPPQEKKPLNLPFLKPLQPPAQQGRCSYLLGSDATTSAAKMCAVRTQPPSRQWPTNTCKCKACG